MYNKFAMNLSKFKKISSDKDHTIMEHEDGHIMRIAHAALSPKMRAEIRRIPAAVKSAQNKSLMADGGNVPDPQSSPQPEGSGQWVEKGSDPDKRKKMADGMKKAFGYADGGVIDYDKLEKEQAEENKPYLIGGDEPVAPAPSESPQQPPQSAVVSGQASPIPASPPVQVQPADQSASPVSQTPGAQSSDAPSQSAPQAQPEQVPAPDTLGGYANQAQGLQKQAVAEGAQGQQQEQALKTQASAVQNMMDQYQDHYNHIDQERQAFQDDIINKHIDPNHYVGSMDFGNKIQTAIGLALGGLGGSGRDNPALDFLNKQIDRDIDAQKAELGKRETLLSANMKQFGNLRDATDMTRLMQSDIIQTQLKQAEAKAMDPISKARAQQQIGALQQQVGPIAQQLATRRMLMSPQAAGSISNMNPSSLVPAIVPKEHQEAVYKELERAQNTRQVAKTALANFDKVAAQMKSAGGLGRIGTAAYSPAEATALEAELGTTVGDQEGTVRETAMHNVKNAYLPRANDTDTRLATRRQELANYMTLKSNAPRAQSFGIDLDKFASTSRDPMASLTPQQQSFAKWAKANPNDPKAALVLKKLGIQ